MDEAVLLAAIALSYGMRAGGAEPAIKPLDGSGISRAEIHAAVSRLLSAADIPGAGIAIVTAAKSPTKNLWVRQKLLQDYLPKPRPEHLAYLDLANTRPFPGESRDRPH